MDVYAPVGKISLYIVTIIILLSFSSAPVHAAKSCHYSSYQWSTVEKKAVHRIRVSKPYTQVSATERDPLTGCSVCEEDQVKLSLPGIPSFYLCHVLARDVEQQLLRLQSSGFPLKQIVGYRPGMTRGKVDRHGNRTQFSNHSFGIALDINPQDNGLYANCISFGRHCRLLRGGHWQPEINPGSIKEDGRVVHAMRRIGLLWGGLIKGKQKDFMHFSPYGY